MDELLDLIFELESSSGKNKKAYIPNPKSGALGGYQIKLGAFQSIQKMFPDKWGNKKFKSVALDDKQARDAAGDVLKFNAVSLANDYGIASTREAMLASYNQRPRIKASGVGGRSRYEGEVPTTRETYFWPDKFKMKGHPIPVRR